MLFAEPMLLYLVLCLVGPLCKNNNPSSYSRPRNLLMAYIVSLRQVFGGKTCGINSSLGV